MGVETRPLSTEHKMLDADMSYRGLQDGAKRPRGSGLLYGTLISALLWISMIFSLLLKH